jgi:hypothetical protein
MRATRTSIYLVLLTAGAALASASTETAGHHRPTVIQVPRDAATIQAAVDRAPDGATIKVAPGRYCGASIAKEVHLVGSWATTIIGCAAPVQSANLRAGFLLVDEQASGSSIRGFRFDGAGVSNRNLTPLAFAVFSRGAHGVSVIGNRIDGTVQAITNSGGEGWTVVGNDISNLTLFDCNGGRCGGGSAIVMQERDTSGDRASCNVVALNQVTGQIPDGHSLFDMVGTFVLGQERPVVGFNRYFIPKNPNAPARGIGVEVSDVCCGLPTPFLTTRGAFIVGNDGRRSQYVVVIDRDASGGTGNTEGAILRANHGTSLVNGVETRRRLTPSLAGAPIQIFE